MRTRGRLTLSQQFLVASLPIVLAGMLVIGLWVQREIERGIVTRLAEVQSLYVDSVVAPHVAGLFAGGILEARERQALDALFAETALGRRIAAFILWSPEGRVLYSSDAALSGREVKLGTGLRTALGGEVYAKVIDRSEQPHPYAGPTWPQRLIEVYAPIRTAPGAAVVGAAEFYQTTSELDAARSDARLRSWGVVAATTIAMYLLLFVLVQRGSRTIDAQRRELDLRVRELTTLADANGVLAARLQDAAARTVALNEGFLRRVAADLHDGPAQDMGFARMRVASFARESTGADPVAVPRADVEAVGSALDVAMHDLRAICAGLQLPDLDALDVNEVVARAVRDYERKAGVSVQFDGVQAPPSVALPIRITLFRVLQEMLANGYRHAGAKDQRVQLTFTPRDVRLAVSDRGPGFDPSSVAGRTRGGLAGMRERVRALGGSFSIDSAAGAGTTLSVTLPLDVPEGRND